MQPFETVNQVNRPTKSYLNIIKIGAVGFGLGFVVLTLSALPFGNSAKAENNTNQNPANTSVFKERPEIKVDAMYLDYNDYIQYVGKIDCALDKDLKSWSSGSGYIADSKGTFITNYHVIDGAVGGLCLVSFSSDFRKEPYEVYVAELTDNYDEDIDFAALKITKMIAPNEIDVTNKSFKFLPACNSNIVRLGDPIVVLGFPDYGGNTITATDGIISGSMDSYFKINAKINHGNSGGPVLIDDPQYGCAIGLATRMNPDDGGEGDVMNLAIKTENINVYNWDN